MKVLQTLSRLSVKDPGRIALREGEIELTYADLDSKSDAVAAFLENCDFPEQPVIGALKSSMISVFVLGLGALKAGVAFSVLDTRDRPERLKEVFRQSGAQLLVVDSGVDTAKLKDFNLPVHHLSEVVQTSPAKIEFDASPSDLSYIEPTSGSTGRPKLVPISQQTLDHYITLQRSLGEIERTDRVALLGEMWFDTLLAGVQAGATLCAFDLRGQGSAGLARWMASERITVMQSFVAAFRALADASDGQFPDLRVVKLAGEVILPSDVTRFEEICGPEAQLINYYGSTECSLITSYTHRHGQAVPDAGLPVGVPVTGTEVVLLAEDGTVAPPGAIGELVARATHMSPGYLNAPERSEGVYAELPDGRRELRTGDLARQTKDGLVIVGRVDDQVKIRGYSVRYSDVEALLTAHDSISSLVVTSVVTPKGIRQLVCHYILKDEAAISLPELRLWMKENAPAYMVPSHFVEHQSFPLTDTGKVLRRALPNPLDRIADASGFQASSKIEKSVAETWENILGHNSFSSDDDFFDIGGDSLQAMSMVIQLERRLSLRVGYESLIMQGATIKDIALRLENAKHASANERHLLLRDGRKKPVYILPVENGEFSDWLYALNAAPVGRPYIGLHARDLSQRQTFPRKSAKDLGRFAAETVRALDPDGPYVFMGYSAGTQLAIETARAVQDQGGAVAGLLLLDPTRLASEPLYRTWHLRRILSPLVKERDLARSANRFAHIVLGRPARELDVADETVFWRYKPEPLHDIPVIMGRAVDDNLDSVAQTAFWRSILGDDMEIWDMPGHHNRILRDPYAAAFAARMDAWLDTVLG